MSKIFKGFIYLVVCVLLLLFIGMALSPDRSSEEYSLSTGNPAHVSGPDKTGEGKNDVIMDIFNSELKLYGRLSVPEKYAILEKIRLELDRLYLEDRETYDKYHRQLKPNTWDALEDAWKLWDPVPKSNGVWSGPCDRTCSLKSSSPYYADCADKGFLQCEYDEHGSPDFGPVTFPGSVVDISDLYDSLSVDSIQKRGGSGNSLQEIAQSRMAEQLETVLREWAERNHVEYDAYTCFYQWRDENNLVPHEDTDCRTMRLVFRPAHQAFTHRGGVSNAVNIKKHFD